MRGSLLIFPLLVICFEHIRAGSDCEPCRDVVEGPNRGFYYLKRSNEPRCWNGCAYERLWYGNSSELEVSTSLWCLNEPGDYLTETCLLKGPGKGWKFVKSGTKDGQKIAVYEKNDGGVLSSLIWCGPFGGVGGEPWNDLHYYANPANGGAPTRIEIGIGNYSGNGFISSIKTKYGNNDDSPWHNSAPTDPTIFDFGDEPITSISVTHKNNSVNDNNIIDYVYGLQFTLNNGTSTPLVGSNPNGTATSTCGPYYFPDCAFAFFSGASANAVDRLDTYWICNTDAATTIQNNFD